MSKNEEIGKLKKFINEAKETIKDKEKEVEEKENKRRLMEDTKLNITQEVYF